MPAPFPQEFREDVIRIAKSREPGVTIAQIAKDFGIHPGTLDNWLRADRVDSGEQPGTTTTEAAELRELRKHNRLLEQENEVLRRAATRRRRGSLSGPVSRTRADERRRGQRGMTAAP